MKEKTQMGRKKEAVMETENTAQQKAGENFTNTQNHPTERGRDQGWRERERGERGVSVQWATTTQQL